MNNRTHIYNIHIYVCMYASVCNTYTNYFGTMMDIKVYKNKRTHIYIYIYIYINIYIYIYIFIYICYMYVCVSYV